MPAAKEKRKMLVSSAYTLHEYDHRFDAGLAQMWNESDDQWPGTFTGGVPLTAERVAEWMDRVAAIVKFVALAPDGKVVGYGDLWETLERPRSAYVALLNVHPQHQGKSLARRMLVEMVNWAAENGYDRITIETWPANLKAMPLYKKVGFFWVPDTTVYMENYIPAVRQLSIARPFFARHDWYRTYQRELRQVEDDMRHPMTGEMKVFILRWQAGEDFLEAVFDRNAQALTGIATPRFAAYARLGESEPAQGVRYPLHWELINHGETPLSISLLASGDPGVALDYRQTLTLRPGEQRTLEASFLCAVDAPKYDPTSREEPTPRIRTLLVVNGEVIELGSGVRYRPPIEVSLEPEVVTLLPGRPQRVHLQLRSRLKRPLQGVVHLAPHPGVTTDWQQQTFSAEAQGYAGIPLSVSAESAGEVPLTVQVSFPEGERTVSTIPKRLTLLALDPGGLAAGEGEDELLLENDFFRLTCKAKGGELKLWNKTFRHETGQLLEELGPPFTPWELNAKTYDLTLERGDGWVKALMCVESGRFAGVVVRREITVTASPLLRLRHWLANTADTAHEFQPRWAFRNYLHEQSYVVVPLRQRTVREDTAQFFNTDDDIPEETEKFAEQWLAFELYGQVVGLIWPQKVDKLLTGWDRFYILDPKKRLAPGEGCWSDPLYLYAGPGDWRLVRDTWRRLNGEKPSQPPLAPPPEAQRYFDFTLTPHPLLTLSDTLEVQLQVSSTRKYALSGQVSLELPPGWEASARNFSFEELTNEKPLAVPLTLSAHGARVGIVQGKLHLQTQLFDAARSFSILRLGEETARVSVTREEREGFECWRLDNGRTQWELAPAFHAGVITWRERGAAANHLLTSFPEEGELSWIKPWYGGLRPVLHDPSERGGWPGKLHRERFTAQRVEAPDSRGLPWVGVQFSSVLAREAFRGLRAEISYLTLPGGNLLKVVYRLVNGTSVYRRAEPGLMAFFQVDGTHENGVIHGEGLQRKRTPQMAWGTVGRWAAVENPLTGRAMVMLNARGWQRVQVMDWGSDGAHLLSYEKVRLPPNGRCEMVVYLALAESLEEARGYRLLASPKP